MPPCVFCKTLAGKSAKVGTGTHCPLSAWLSLKFLSRLLEAGQKFQNHLLEKCFGFLEDPLAKRYLILRRVSEKGK
jgi:hypothetical protein